MTAITVDHLTKIYHRCDSPTARMEEALHPVRKKDRHDFYAQNGLTNPVRLRRLATENSRDYRE